MPKSDIVIFKSKWPIWKRFFAAALFTFGLICIYHLFFTPPRPDIPNNPGNIISWAFISFLSFMFGLKFLPTLDYEIDLEEGRYKVSKSYFKRREGRWKYFNYVEFVSIQKSSKKIFKVNIWFNRKNKTLSAKFNSYVAAMDFAKKAAHSLDAKLYDHTVGNGKVEIVDF